MKTVVLRNTFVVETVVLYNTFDRFLKPIVINLINYSSYPFRSFLSEVFTIPFHSPDT